MELSAPLLSVLFAPASPADGPARAAPSEDRWSRPAPASDSSAPAAAAAATSDDKWRPRGARETPAGGARSDDRPAPAPGKFVPAHLRRKMEEGGDSAAAPPAARPTDGDRSGGYVPPAARRAGASSGYGSRDREEPPRGGRSGSRW